MSPRCCEQTTKVVIPRKPRRHGTKTRFYVRLRDLQGYRAMWADFVRAWTTGEPPQMTLSRARRDLELVERAYASALEAA
jgi:predicted dehydrogenase